MLSLPSGVKWHTRLFFEVKRGACVQLLVSKSYAVLKSVNTAGLVWKYPDSSSSYR